MKTKYIISLSITLLFSTFIFSQEFTNYSTVDGLAHNLVWSIAIDKDGNKWFGTSNGVSKFDGTNWTNYRTTNSNLIGNYIRAIAIDKDGNKWFGTNKGISKFDGINWTNYDANTGLVLQGIYSIAFDSQNIMWVGIPYQGIAKFDGTNWTKYNINNSGLIDNSVLSIVIDAQGNKWFGTSKGVSKFDGTNWTNFEMSDGPPSNYIASIAIDSQGNKWFGTQGGVYKYDGANWTKYTIDNGLIGNDIRAIAIDKNDTKWFGNNGNNGLVKLDTSLTWTYYSVADGLASNNIWSIAVDKNNNMWFGTYGHGVSKLLGDKINNEKNLNFQNSEVLFKYAGPDWKVKFDNPFIPLDYDSDGDIDFIGGLQNKQYLIKNIGNNSFEAIVIANNNDTSPLKAIDFDNDGDLDVILERSILINEGNDEFSLMEINPKLGSYIADCTDFNNDGYLDLIFQYSGTSNDALSIWFSQNTNFNYVIDTLITGYNEYGDLDIGDIDGDGDDDFILYNYQSGDNTIIFYNDNLVFRQVSIPKIFSWERKSIELADLEGDGDLDFILSDDSYIYLVENDGNPTEYKNRIRVENLLFFNSGDFDNDGDMDLVLVQKTDTRDLTICIMEYLGNYEFGEPKVLAEFTGSSSFNLQQNDNYNSQNISLIDYNGDGKLDIAFTQGFTAPSTMNIILNTTYIDNDNDNFELTEDCDDNNPNINPGQVELPYNGIDDDCNPSTLDDDLDQDGFLFADDCDDNNSSIYPGAEEIPNNGIDEDCDGEDLITGTHDLANSKIRIFPNPVTDVLNIQMNGQLNFETSLFDLRGKLILLNKNQKLINVESLPNGSYFLEIKDLITAQKIVEKIVIKK